MKKLFNIFLFLIVICQFMSAQDSLTVDKQERSYQLLFELDIKAAILSTDILQNIYVVDSSGVLIKFNSTGKELYRYNEFRLSDPGHLDITNPFQILIYYPEYQTVVTLDNTLSKTSEFDLYSLDLDIIETICFSNDGNIWLYDSVRFFVKKINRNLETLLSSNLLSLQIDKAIEPTYMVERENWVFLNDPDMGVLIFDVYGQYAKTLEIKGLQKFQVRNNLLLYVKDKKLHGFNLNTLDQYPITLPTKLTDGDQVRIEKNRMFIARKNKIEVYKF